MTTDFTTQKSYFKFTNSRSSKYYTVFLNKIKIEKSLHKHKAKAKNPSFKLWLMKNVHTQFLYQLKNYIKTLET